MIGDSQVRIDDVHVAALELIDDFGNRGLGFIQFYFEPLPRVEDIVRLFTGEAWPSLLGQHPLGLVHRVSRFVGATSGPTAYPSTKGSRWRSGIWPVSSRGCL